VREDDDVAQRQHRVGPGFAGDQRRLWLCASHGPRSLLLCPSPSPADAASGRVQRCRGGHGAGRVPRGGTKPSPRIRSDPSYAFSSQ
jgi:hypothetical protein